MQPDAAEPLMQSVQAVAKVPIKFLLVRSLNINKEQIPKDPTAPFSDCFSPVF